MLEEKSRIHLKLIREDESAPHLEQGCFLLVLFLGVKKGQSKGER
jgi:hypothetical protein